MKAAMERARTRAANVRSTIAESALVEVVKTSSIQMVDSAKEANKTRQLQKRAVMLRSLLISFDFVRYNEQYFLERSKLRDGIFAVPKCAWEKVLGSRRRILVNVEKTGSAAAAKRSEVWRGSITGAALGTVATVAAASAIGVAAAPIAVGFGAVSGACILSGRLGRKADDVLGSMKGNEKAMATVFEGIIGSLASRYGNEDTVSNSWFDASSGMYQNEWGSLGADTVSKEFGRITLWASGDGLRIRIQPTAVEVQRKSKVIFRLLMVPSLVEYVLLRELGSLPPKDLEVIGALMNILSSPRGHKIANHMDLQSKQLMVSLFGGEKITFNAEQTQRLRNILYESSSQTLKTIERTETGKLVASRETIHGDCIMPLPSNEPVQY